MHKFRSKRAALAIHARYIDMHERRPIKVGSRWAIIGIFQGKYHALGDHGWAYDVPYFSLWAAAHRRA